MDPSGNKFVSSIWNEYSQHVPRNLMVIDAYLTCVFFTGVIQFIYCLIIGNFPFNAFLSGFISCVGTFVLTVCLRMQINPNNTSDPANKWKALTPARVFADWLIANLILHTAVLNFIG
mmetsp:Transcript_1943/g.3467  ORF Transcript_1943/g.3467 Transcript_1943/m.3467 type:complete len:118 (-) Transcript_1943:322-675(-)